MNPDTLQPIDLAELTAADLEDGTRPHRIRTSVHSRFVLDAYLSVSPGSSRLICLLPSAQTSRGPIRNPVFHRWSWASQFSDAHVLVLSDPALYTAPECPAAWFLDVEVDLIAELARFVTSVATLVRVDTDAVLTYGSSMGGFGALMLATELDGACAIAEVPQLDLRVYPVQSAMRAVESQVLGTSIDLVYDEAPERISLVSRIKRARRIPSMQILTNTSDLEYSAHIALLAGLPALRDSVDTVGTVRLEVTADAPGHQPLPTPRALAAIRALIARGWTSDRVDHEAEGAEPAKEELPYGDLIQQAVSAIEKIRFVRDPADETWYRVACDTLRRAAEVNATADWPYLRLCSLMKTWTNSFNRDILDAARDALTRRESLEAFIYACRGIFYNLDPDEARVETQRLMEQTVDPQIANVGQLFLGMASYEQGDFAGYRESIEAFRRERAADFEPYIAIPASTVYTGTGEELDLDRPQAPRLLGSPVPLPEVPAAAYTVIVSCDQVYFERYARFVAKSFSMTNPRGRMVMVVLNGDDDALGRQLAEWGADYVTAVGIALECGQNLGPMASLLRFSMVTELLRRDARPVIVLDLDTVVTADFGILLASLGEADVASRILGYGVAPWEKYTGGFAIFMPTPAAQRVAEAVAGVAQHLARPGSPQWWIDQNCFEAGIRLGQESQAPPRIANVMAARNNYCVMPVGPADAKMELLERALQSVEERVANSTT